MVGKDFAIHDRQSNSSQLSPLWLPFQSLTKRLKLPPCGLSTRWSPRRTNLGDCRSPYGVVSQELGSSRQHAKTPATKMRCGVHVAVCSMASDDGKVKRKRARTGCLKCRIRRRKCDEEKPKCRNCRHGGHQCQYGTRLSFLDKNAITLPTPNASDSSIGSKYRRLQFVEPPVTAASSSPKPSPAVTKIISPSRQAQSSPSSTAPERGLDLDGSNHGYLPDDSSPSILLAQPAFQGQLPVQDAHLDLTHSSIDLSETSPGTGAYQTALDVLITLGGNSKAPSTPAQPGVGAVRTPVSHVAPDLEDALEPFATCRHAPQAPIVRLLRHYVYNIAPWLDTGDPDRTLRTRVSQLSLESQPLLDSLLALSSTSLLATSRQKENVCMPSNELMPELPFSSEAEAAALAMTCVRMFMLTDPFSWPVPAPFPALPSQQHAASEDGKGLSLSTAWLVLRLGLGRGLMQDESVTIPDMLLHAVSTPSGRGWSRDLLDYDRQPILLCARALNYCFARKDEGYGPGLRSRVDAWKEIFNSLDLWYSNRPQDFRPVLEIDKQDRLFPLLLFTSSAAIMANQMYHTAMLLLLQQRPRTLAAELGRSANLSPLRHAQKICGISLNNTGQSSWDFSLVASFYMAAKRMTYAPQQDTILKKLEQVRDMMGWNLSSLAPQLRQGWNPV
ncbi:hypothetical protein NLU13_0676 [Sarocladium strictum]|uniref:Zn(2)-C6 fungal-type domain-containing protein n=1 Tax=Sarocladium strictum TaxID=5046 RepID=A0AA39LBN0_SARSR|nr:hypothetical protein NLU13_0676 [Sarocladium strictum]